MQQEQLEIGKVYKDSYYNSVFFSVSRNKKGVVEVIDNAAYDVPWVYKKAALVNVTEASLKESIAYLKSSQKEVCQRIHELQELQQLMKSSLEKLRDIQDGLDTED